MAAGGRHRTLPRVAGSSAPNDRHDGDYPSDMTDPDRLCRTADIERLVRRVDDDWRVRTDEPIAAGRHSLHRLGLETSEGDREVVLKVPVDDVDRATEPRLLAVLAEHAELPVPAVLGVVDEAADLPTPAFVLEALPGESVHKTETDDLDRGTLRRIAVASGRLLAELHRIDAVDRFGVVEVDAGAALDGERPSGSLDRLSVPDGDERWPEHVETSFVELCEGLAGSQFEGAAEEIERTVGPLVDDLREDVPFEPVLGRTEHSLDNLLFDPDAGEVTGLLDWEFVAATTAANDLALAAFWLSGGPWGLLPGTPDYRDLVREGLLAGYRDGGGDVAVTEFRDHRALYELLVTARTMLLFDELLDHLDPSATERSAAADELRARVAATIDRT